MSEYEHHNQDEFISPGDGLVRTTVPESLGAGLLVTERRYMPGQDHRVERPQGQARHVVSVGLQPADHLRIVQSTGRYEGVPPRGSFYICPQHDPMVCEWSSTRPTWTVHLTPSIRQWDSAFELYAGRLRPNDLRAAFHDPDPVVTHLAGLAQCEVLGCGTGSALFIDTLGYTLAEHLVRRYLLSDAKRTDFPVGRLDPGRLASALEFMHENITRPVRLANISAAAQMSEFHFSRCFHRSTGYAPHQYLLAIRVDRAKAMLTRPAAERLPLAEIALACGFNDQSHFSRHFKARIGTTPGRFARQVS
ncbi:MAG: AraC family transcriptional regulator [Planctomycetota bacterium]